MGAAVEVRRVELVPGELINHLTQAQGNKLTPRCYSQRYFPKQQSPGSMPTCLAQQSAYGANGLPSKPKAAADAKRLADRQAAQAGKCKLEQAQAAADRARPRKRSKAGLAVAPAERQAAQLDKIQDRYIKKDYDRRVETSTTGRFEKQKRSTE